MEVIGKPLKFMPWQVTKIKDNFGTIKINLRLYNKMKGGGFNYSKCQQLYIELADWETLKIHIRGTRRKNEVQKVQQ